MCRPSRGRRSAPRDGTPRSRPPRHMPSHTFTRVGAWDESIEANLRSAEAAHRERAVSDEMHAMDYLVYAYLQTARDAAAREVATALGELLAGLPQEGASGLTAAT